MLVPRRLRLKLVQQMMDNYAPLDKTQYMSIEGATGVDEIAVPGEWQVVPKEGYPAPIVRPNPAKGVKA